MTMMKLPSGSTVKVASGSKTTRSASRPGAIAPLRPESPTSRAGARGHPAGQVGEGEPAPAASVQTAGRASWSEAMPPQARKTSPVSRCLSSGGAGEWSEPIVSIRP